MLRLWMIRQEGQNKKVADMMNGGKVELPVVFTLKPYEYYILKK